MAYVDLNTLHNPSTGTAPPATWGDQVRDNDEYLLNRGPYICTSATRPGSPFEGQTIYETDTDKYYTYSGSAWGLLVGMVAWDAYTTTWSGTLGNGTKVAYYTRIGRSIFFRIKLTWGSTTSHAAATQTFTLPVAPHADYSVNACIGTCALHDSGVAVWNGTFLITSGSTAALFYKSDTAGVAVTNTVPYTWNTSDQAFVQGTYEAAS